MTVRHHHALVIGKFYPPHRGHLALIDAAAAAAGRVSVVVMASSAESVPLAARVAWLRADLSGRAVTVVGVQCEAPVDLGDDLVWVAQVEAMRSALRCTGAGPVDVVVSGEAYGLPLADRFGVDHIEVDRSVDPVSATTIRADPVARWADLIPSARAGLACRVVVLGAESTGTTTVAGLLADRFRRRGGVWAATGCVEEHGRRYTGELWAAQCDAALAAGRPVPALTDVVWGRADFDTVAVTQTANEEAAAASGSPLLVCDTDALATMIWERRYLGADARPAPPWACPPALPHHDLYLLTSHRGVPWTDDGIREGDLAVRAAMTDWFADALTAAGHPWVLLEGTLEQRVDLALRSIDPVLRRRLTFSSPLTGPGFEASV